MRSKIDELQWDMIVDRLHTGRCVPFLGAGVNIDRKEPPYKGLPLGGQVAQLFASRLRYSKARATELARIALEYEVRSDRNYLMEFLRQALPDEQLNPSPLLETLAQLPLGLVVTTNYDRLLERALTDKGLPFELLVQPPGGFENTKEVTARLSELEHYKGTIVYKIHGSFDHHSGPTGGAMGSPSSPRLIITEDDYIEFLAVQAQQSERIGVPKFIRSIMTPSTLLFLGYGLQDWDFRTIYRGLVGHLEKHDVRASFAIQKSPPKYWTKYWERQGIEIFNMDIYEFAEQFKDRYFAKYPQATT